MWSFQQHFRTSVEYEIQHALDAIGVALDPRVVLIGYARDDRLDSVRHAICVEPETGALTVADFASVAERTQRAYEEDPESTLRHSHPDVHNARQRWVWHRARATATAEAIEASGALGDVAVTVSQSSPVGDYEVHTCVALDAPQFNGLRVFDGEFFDRQYAGESLAHAVVREALWLADRALYLPDPGQGLEVLGVSTQAFVRSAAERFAYGCVVRSGQMLGGEPFETLNEITALAYEKTPALGELLVVRPDHPALSLHVELTNPVSIREHRAVRKLIETTDKEASLLTDGRDVYGVGRVDDIDQHADVFRVSLPAHATWEMSSGGRGLMRVAYGKATLPRPVLDRSAFEEVLTRRLDGANSDLLWPYVEAAAVSRHGTTIVVSAGADAEAQRLAGEATLIAPARLSVGDFQRASRIDGAILFDRDGICHAVGVILDGPASGIGDPSRGSRFNSSLKYVNSAPAVAVVVVISDDGMVDLVPRLQPRIRREVVDDAVATFLAAAETADIDGEPFGRAISRVQELRFYLTDEQCNRVNEVYEREQERRFAAGGIAIRRAPLTPDPAMSDDYFIDD